MILTLFVTVLVWCVVFAVAPTVSAWLVKRRPRHSLSARMHLLIRAYTDPTEIGTFIFGRWAGDSEGKYVTWRETVGRGGAA